MKEFIEIPFGTKDSELVGWEYNIPEGYTASIENGKIIVKKEESDDEKMKKEITELVMQPTWKTEKEFKRRNELCAWLEKQGEQKDEEDTDFTIYHPLKNDKGEYECIPYSFYGTLTSFSEDIDLINFLRNCFYSKEECEEWIKKQGEQNPTDEEMKILLQTEYEKGKADAIEQKSAWCEEDENRFRNLIYLVENSEEGIGTKRGFIEFINRLKSLNGKEKLRWKPTEEQIQALEYQVHSTYEGSWQYRASKELLEQLKKL